MFVIKPQKHKGSPLAVDGIKKKLSRREILQSIEEEQKLQSHTALEFSYQGT
jgi:hypothetical protein